MVDIKSDNDSAAVCDIGEVYRKTPVLLFWTCENTPSALNINNQTFSIVIDLLHLKKQQHLFSSVNTKIYFIYIYLCTPYTY